MSIASKRADSYAVLGNPVAHSLSPRIHRHFAEQTAQSISYSAIELAVDGFAAGLLQLRQDGLRGANVTLPFKQQAWEICDRLSARAENAAAVNTLSFNNDGSIAGDNTDGVGLIRDLCVNLGLSLEQRNILILGAGGAVRGVLGPLLELSPGNISIANRNLHKARQLQRDFSARGAIRPCAYAELAGENYDLVINATAAELSHQLPPLPHDLLLENALCYDMMYNIHEPTRFVSWALAQGAAQACDGLGMLVEQAAESFFIWRGVRPDSAPVIRSLRQP